MFFKNSLKLHRKIGKLYTRITLLCVCPTGMYLALYAKGGLITQIGFMIQGILLGLFTYRGYQAIIRGDQSGHLAFVARSYAMAAVVLSFRILHILFFLWKIPYHINYALSQWLGLAGNALLTEMIILYLDYKIKNGYHLKQKMYETIN